MSAYKSTRPRLHAHTPAWRSWSAARLTSIVSIAAQVPSNGACSVALLSSAPSECRAFAYLPKAIAAAILPDSLLSLSRTHTLRQINSWPLWCHPSPGQSERPEGWVHYVSAKQGSTLESQSDGPCGPEREADGKETHTHTHDQLWRSATVGQSVRVGACQHRKSTLFGCT